ncbi:MAG: protein-L-isoaspartate O-methyltransferase family protein [Devosia sp.]
MAMIDSQLRSSGVTERRLIAAFLDVPRELFVAEGRKSVAYVDDLQPLGAGKRFILSPAHFGRMAQLAEIVDSSRVLDVGAATGYSTAVLARIAAHVVGIEVDSGLVDLANGHLAQLGVQNASVIAGGTEAAVGQLFDAIVVEGAVEVEPHDLIALLAPGGRLVVPLLRRGIAVIHVIQRNDDGVMFTSEFDATMPRLWSWVHKDEFVF